MTGTFGCLNTALTDRCIIEREFAAGGMAVM
jgi:hypothetical protein